MEKQFYVDYLYPERTDIESSSLFDYEITGLLESEKKYMEAIHITDFEEKFGSSLNRNEYWTKENIEKGTKILAEHPQYIPFYIARNAKIILNEFLGIFSFPYLANLDTDLSLYLKAKHHLSVFLSVIEHLCNYGVNIAAFPINYSQFTFLGKPHMFSELSNNDHFYRAIDEAVLHYYQSERISKRSLLQTYGRYTNIEEWAEEIKKVMDRVETSALIPDPRSLDFKKKQYYTKQIIRELETKRGVCYSSNQASIDESPSSEDMVIASEYIDSVLKVLKEVDKKSELKVALTLIKKILKRLKGEKETGRQMDLIGELKDILNSLPNEEQRKNNLSPEKDQEFNCILDEAKSIIKSNNNEPNIEDDEISKLNNKIKKMQEELNELKSIIYDYLENGGKKPLIPAQYASNEEIKDLLMSYKCKNSSQKIRQIILFILLNASLFMNAFCLKNHIIGNEDAITLTKNESTFEEEVDSEEKKDLLEEEPLKENPIESIPEEEENIESLNDFSQEFYIGKPIQLTNAPIYNTIYSTSPLGERTVNGSIIGYFPYQIKEDKRIWFHSIRTEEDLNQFLASHEEDIDELKWKVAITEEDIQVILDNMNSNDEVRYQLTTYFTDYNPVLKKEISSSEIKGISYLKK